MTWGTTLDEGNGPFVIGAHQKESITEETEQQETETQPSHTKGTSEEAATQGTRRSTRQTSKPNYLDDYILLAEVECELLLLSINDEPANFHEPKDSKQWTDACEDEIESINKNNTQTLVDKPTGVKIIDLKWVFKIKRNADGSINKFKARLVAKGYVQEHEIDLDEVFSPVARLETIRLLIGLDAANKWEIHHLDVKTAFLHGELSEDVYVSQPEGFEKKGEEHKVFNLSKALYGLRQAPRAWNTKLDQILKRLRSKSVQKKVLCIEEKMEAIYSSSLYCG